MRSSPPGGAARPSLALAIRHVVRPASRTDPVSRRLPELPGCLPSHETDPAPPGLLSAPYPVGEGVSPRERQTWHQTRPNKDSTSTRSSPTDLRCGPFEKRGRDSLVVQGSLHSEES